MQNTDAKRSKEIDSLLLQLDSTLHTLSHTKEQMSHIPAMVSSVVGAGVVPDLAVDDHFSISQKISVVFEKLIESLWERGIFSSSLTLSFLLFCINGVYRNRDGQLARLLGDEHSCMQKRTPMVNNRI